MSFNVLSATAAAISPTYIAKIDKDDELWKGSPFDYIRRLPSRTRGKIGQQLVHALFRENGYSLQERSDSFEVRGKSVISRSSRLWEGDYWKFQQLRDTPIDYLFCLGFAPKRAFAWLIPQAEIYKNGEFQVKEDLGRQHGGSRGREDAWLKVTANAVPKWLEPFGGDVEGTAQLLKRALG